MPMRRRMTIGIVILLALSSCAFAGANYGTAKVIVHVEPHTVRTCSKDMPVITTFEDIVTTLATPDADCFPVFYDLNEYQYLDYSLTWPGLNSCAFTSCSELTVGAIAVPGDGVSQGWYACQAGPAVVPGWAWIYDYGEVCVAVHPDYGVTYVGDCLGQYDEVVVNQCAEIGTSSATEAGTWGKIKILFE